MRWIATLALVGTCALGACESTKPSKERCTLAVENIRKIYDSENSDVGAKPETMIRSCRNQSSKEAVECMIAAKSVDDLVACEGKTGADYYEKQKAHEAEAQKKEADKAKDSADSKDGKETK